MDRKETMTMDKKDGLRDMAGTPALPPRRDGGPDLPPRPRDKAAPGGVRVEPDPTVADAVTAALPTVEETVGKPEGSGADGAGMTGGDAKDGRPAGPMPKKRHGVKRVMLVGVGVAAVLALAACGGAYAWHHDQAGRLASAQEACAAAHADAVKAREALAAYLKSDEATAAAKVGKDQVKDAGTVDALASTVRAASDADPAVPDCAGDRAALEGAKAALEGTSASLGRQLDGVRADVKAVSDSRLAKTVDTATALYEDSDGKVADAKTRDRLKQAIDGRDPAALAKATDEVNASMKAKADADAKAQADAQAQAQAEAQAQQYVDGGQAYAGGGQSNGGYAGGGYSYSGGGSAYAGGGYTGGGYTGGGQSAAPQAPAQQQTTQGTGGTPYIPDTQGFEVQEGDPHGSHGTHGGEVWW